MLPGKLVERQELLQNINALWRDDELRFTTV